MDASTLGSKPVDIVLEGLLRRSIPRFQINKTILMITHPRCNGQGQILLSEGSRVIVDPEGQSARSLGRVIWGDGVPEDVVVEDNKNQIKSEEKHCPRLMRLMTFYTMVYEQSTVQHESLVALLLTRVELVNKFEAGSLFRTACPQCGMILCSNSIEVDCCCQVEAQSVTMTINPYIIAGFADETAGFNLASSTSNMTAPDTSPQGMLRSCRPLMVSDQACKSLLGWSPSDLAVFVDSVPREEVLDVLRDIEEDLNYIRVIFHLQWVVDEDRVQPHGQLVLVDVLRKLPPT
jgi:hypothetical protein